jgi:hypothetical protein
MPYRIEQTPPGWSVFRAGDEASVAGPFPSHQAAREWIEQQGREAEIKAQHEASEARAEALSDPELARTLKAAIENPPPPPRGRPPPDASREADIAFEYYWRVRQHRRLPNTTAAVAKVYGVTADHVRKVRKEYAAVANYDRHLLKELRAQAVERRTKPPKLPHRRESPKSEQARQWLRALLEHNSMLSSGVIYRRADVAGFSRRTIERAKASLGVISARGGRSSSWRLPSR